MLCQSVSGKVLRDRRGERYALVKGERYYFSQGGIRAALLDRLIALPEHGFWPDSLLALAIANGGRLATLDRGVMSLRGAEGAAELLV